jgi:hypothetical protein
MEGAAARGVLRPVCADCVAGRGSRVIACSLSPVRGRIGDFFAGIRLNLTSGTCGIESPLQGSGFTSGVPRGVAPGWGEVAPLGRGDDAAVIRGPVRGAKTMRW